MGHTLELLTIISTLGTLGECWYYSTLGSSPPQPYGSFHQSLVHHPTPLLSSQLAAITLYPGHLSSNHERFEESSSVANELGWGLPVGKTPLYVRLDNGLFVPVKAVYALPPFLERLVQRVQGYYSVYNPPDNLLLNRPVSGVPLNGAPPNGVSPPPNGLPQGGTPVHQGGVPLPQGGLPLPPGSIPFPQGGVPPPPGGVPPGVLPQGAGEQVPLTFGLAPGPQGLLPLVPQGPPPPPRPHDPDVSLTGPPGPPPVDSAPPPPPPTPAPEQPITTESDVEQVTETTTEP